MHKETKSYKMFTTVYEHVFNYLNNANDTIFENMDYKPRVDVLYEQFIKSPEYQLFLENDIPSQKYKIINNWIYENVFLEAYFDVKYQLIIENNTLPYSIEYKLNKSFEVIEEGKLTSNIIGFTTAAAGTAAALLGHGLLVPSLGVGVTILSMLGLISDSTKRDIVTIFETLGKKLGQLLTLSYDTPLGTGLKREILTMIDAKQLADSLEECDRIVSWNPADSSKITRFYQRIMNSHKEYDYASCIGTKLIKFYITTLEIVYKILKASDVDNKAFVMFKDSLNRALVNEAVFRNIARLARNKNFYKLLEVINKASKAIQDMIQSFINSKDPEYARIGHDLSKQLESELRGLAYKIEKEMRSRPALNRRDESFYKENRKAEHSKPNTRDFEKNDFRKDNNNPF